MRTTRKVLCAVVLACAVGFLVPSHALAGGPPAPGYAGCVIELNPTEASPGDSVNLVGSGFQPAFTTEIFIDGLSVGTVLTDGSGAFDTDREVPEGAGPGTVTVSAACDGTGANVSSSELTILGDAPPATTPSTTPVDGAAAADEGDLPQTGNDVEPLVVIGGLAVLAGAAFVLVAKRRRSNSSQA